jgi:hypothetical protein
MGASTEELQKHVKEISERIRKGEYPGFLDAKVVKWVEVSIQYAEAVVAVLLDAVERYTDAAARDRESQEKNRRVQRVQTWAMVALTFALAVSTALYTYAAWRPARQSDRFVSPIAASPLPGTTPAAPQSPQPPTRDQ